MKLEIYKGYEGFEKIESEWYKLYRKLSSPVYSQSPIWHKAYLCHLVVTKEKCFYFCIYKNQNLIAIFPLENVRRKIYLISLNTLSFSSHSHFGINSVIVDEDENVQSTFEFLYQSLKKEKSIAWDLIYFNRAIENSQTILCKINNHRLLTQSSSQTCDVLPIQNYDMTFKKFSRNLKRNLKKGREGILEMDNFEYKSSYNDDTLDVNFDIFMDVEASGWKGVNGEGSAIKLDDNLRSFYHEVMNGFSKHEQVEINTLFINNKPVAAQYAIVLEPNVFLLKIGYDENYSNLSPGNLLIEYKLKQYVNNPKLATLNLVSDAKWHRQWKPNVLFSYKIYNCKNVLVATYLKSFLWLKNKIKSIKSKL